MGSAARLAGCQTDRRDPDRIEHGTAEMLRLRMFAITAGFEDANDSAKPWGDPIFKMALGRTPASGAALCSQPTLSRLENAAAKIDLARMMVLMIHQFCASWNRSPGSIVAVCKAPRTRRSLG